MTYNENEIAILNDYLPLRYEYLESVASKIQNVLSRYLINRDEEGRDIDVYNIYAIKSRTKSPQSLITKIRDKIRNKDHPIDKNNYKDVIEDLVGVRVVCYHPSDLEVIKELICGLKTLSIIDFVYPKKLFWVYPEKPLDNPPPFILPTLSQENVGINSPATTGYSSVHSIIRLKEKPECKIELQLRTLLEETWGEINHFHQYKKGIISPPLKQGFYVLSALLGACNLKVDYLKYEAKNQERRKKLSDEEKAKKAQEMWTTFDIPLKDSIMKAGFPEIKIIGKIYDFLKLRFQQHKDEGCPIFKGEKLPEWQECFRHILSPEVIKLYSEVYEKVIGQPPFFWPGSEGELKNNTDLKNLADFGICLCENSQNKEICQKNLEFILKKRKDE